MQNWLGIIVSFAFVFGVLGVAQLLAATKLLPPPITRKVVHIGVAHWWLLAIPLFDSLAFAVVGPIAFIFLNALSMRRGIFTAMEAPREPGKPYNLGTLFFPVSLLVLVMLTFRSDLPVWIGGLGILVLGWGDGMAAIIGMVAGTRRYNVFGQRKSVQGTAGMFVFSLAVVLIYSYIHLDGATGLVLAAALATAAVATLTEAITPLGLDNLTVPLVTSLFYYGVFLA